MQSVVFRKVRVQSVVVSFKPLTTACQDNHPPSVYTELEVKKHFVLEQLPRLSVRYKEYLERRGALQVWNFDTHRWQAVSKGTPMDFQDRWIYIFKLKNVKVPLDYFSSALMSVALGSHEYLSPRRLGNFLVEKYGTA